MWTNACTTDDNWSESLDEQLFESAIQALESELANAGAHTVVDVPAREAYGRQITAMSRELRDRALSGRITWKEAAEEAHEMRNVIMEALRGRSTPVGRSIAEWKKANGRTMNELIAKYTQQQFGATADFTRLSPAQQDRVYAELVDAAARSDPKINRIMRTAKPAGRALIVVSIGISVYQIATAEDMAGAAQREVVVTGAGIGGGMLGGAIAGLACGPGAPVCVTIGAFVGGAVAAFGVDCMW